MERYRTDNGRGRLLSIYATVCALLLLTTPFPGGIPGTTVGHSEGLAAEGAAGRPVPGADPLGATARPTDFLLPSSKPGNPSVHTNVAHSIADIADIADIEGVDDTEPHRSGNTASTDNKEDRVAPLLGLWTTAETQQAGAISGFAPSPGSPYQGRAFRGSAYRETPEDEALNMGLLANLPRSGTNSDLAFWGDLAIAGNYNGFRVINIANPGSPTVLSTVTCRGPQNDVSVWGDLVFLSVDRPQTAPTCSGDATNPNDPSAFEGIRIFNISDPSNPQYVVAVPTDCGSHTHTLIPDLAQNRVLLYVSSYYTGSGPHCGPGREADGRHKKISIVSVPLNAPEQAAVIATPEVNADPFDFGSGPTIGCHDITVFLDLHIAGAACMSEGQLWDITDPANPQTLDPVVRLHNSAFDFWHSSTFSWDGNYVVFSDETFSNGCASPSDPNGRIWIYANSPPYSLLSSFVQPRPPSGSEYCSAHLYNTLPATDGSKLLASSWYEGAVDLVNFDDPTAPREEGFYHARQPVAADTWSAYWYNDYIYAGDIARGFDVYTYTTALPHDYVQLPYLNPQTQEQVLLPPGSTPTPTSSATSTAVATATSTVVPTGTGTATASRTPTLMVSATAQPSTSTPVACTSIPFSDVGPSDYFYEAVRYLYCRGVVSGYADGTFRPYNDTTRGQLSKIVVLAVGWSMDTTGGPHFTDVPAGHPFYAYIETAYNHGIISGYADGTFRWANNITRGQLSKVTVLAMGWDIYTPPAPTFTDVPAGHLFYAYIETAYNHGIISGYADGTFRPSNNATRGQISKIVFGAVTGP